MYSLYYIRSTPLDLDRSTYSLKHDVEGHFVTHISERAFIAAAVAFGFGIEHRGGSAYLTLDRVVRSPELEIPAFIVALTSIEGRFHGTAKQLSELLGVGPTDYRVAKRLVQQHKNWLKKHRIAVEFPVHYTKHARTLTVRRMRRR